MINAETLAKNAIEKTYFIDEYRGKLLRPLILKALMEMAEAIDKIDKTQTHTLLADVDTQLAELLDQRFLLTTLAKKFQTQKRLHEPYSKLMKELLATAGGSDHAFAGIINGNISLHQAIQTEINKFVSNINVMAQRIAKDLDTVINNFSITWQEPADAATGIIKLESAGRFSFDGGKRIIILTLNNDKKIIYKPRDIRIETKLVGHAGKNNEHPDDDANCSFIELINALLKEELGGQFIPLSTHRFLPCRDERGHYGYVEYLQCGTESDNFFTQKKAKKLYRQLGQLTGIALILGLYDLLPCNVRISRNNIFFTDADIVFEKGILDFFRDELSDINCITVPPSSIKRSLLTNFWQHNLNNVRPASLYVVENDKIILNPRLSNNNNTKVVATENLVIVDQQGSNCNLKSASNAKNIHTFYAAEVKQGFNSLFFVINRSEQARQRIKKFIINLSGLQVRYFPFIVISSLLQRIYTDYLHDYSEPEKLHSKIKQEINKLLIKKQSADSKSSTIDTEQATALADVIFDSLVNGDYLYITQKLGSGALYYRGNMIQTNAVAEYNNNNETSVSNPLALAIKIIDKLSHKATLQNIEKFAECYEAYIQSLAMPSIPPNYAIAEFINRISLNLARQLGYSKRT